MQYGVFLLMSRRDLDLSPAEVIAQGLEQAVAAEELGFSDVWIAEHHFSNYGMVPAPLYLVLLMIAFPLVLYLPTHLVLKRLFN